MPAEVPVIAIDGPGGAGKGTVALAVSRALGWRLLDSGALYRLVALAAHDHSVDPGDESAVAALAGGLEIGFDTAADPVRILLGGQDVTAAIRAEDVGATASRIAPLPAVRAALLERQRALRRPPGLVADGRDMGSVVFPDAGLKIFLTASVRERARRRYKQLKEKGIDVSFSALSADMAERDRRDTERAVAPLVAVADARILDTTDLSIEAAVAAVLGWAREVWPQD